MTNPFNDKGLVGKTPIITTLLLEYANLGQLWRMWSEHSALGQNIWSWLAVHVALWAWWNFYRVMLPDDKLAKYMTALGIFLNGLVVFSVAYFRYFH